MLGSIEKNTEKNPLNLGVLQLGQTEVIKTITRKHLIHSSTCIHNTRCLKTESAANTSRSDQAAEKSSVLHIHTVQNISHQWSNQS